jgi:hypothetical protein
MKRILSLAWIVILVATGRLGAQQADGSAPTEKPPAESGGAAREWGVSFSAYTYIVPNGEDYVQPTVTADLGRIHLEARYNYEDLDTGSVWAGYRLGGGRALEWELIPMLGAVFGEITGVAPGYRGSLSWWWLELYSEGEYVVDVDNSSDSFFYMWTELTVSPLGWFRAGLVTQRTQVYQTDFDVQRGFLLGFSVWKLDVTGHVFNPEDDPVWVVSAAFGF